MASPKNIDNGSIYELVDRTRVEAKSDIIRLEAKVDILQDAINRLQVKEATLNTKVYMLVFIISTTISAIVSAAALRILK